MEKHEDQRYLFHAYAMGFGGTITSPFYDVIEAQASAVLPITGGSGSARVENFRYREIVSFKAAYSTVIGEESKERRNVYETLATVTVEGLNIANVVTADAVVARLVWHVDLDQGTREVLPVGSYFVNLRIGGRQIDLKPRNVLFENGGLPGLTDACRGKNFSNLADRLEELQGAAVGPREPLVSTCLFDMTDVPAGCRKREASDEYGVRVPGFGTVYLAEYYITRHARQLSMLRIEMGCPGNGSSTSGHVGGNGSPN